MNSKPSPSRGFSLVEALIALAILALVVTMSLVIVFERQRRLLAAHETILAYQLIANEVEAYRRVAYDSLVAEEEYPFLVDSPMLAELPGADGRVRVGQEDEDYKVLAISLTWGGTRTARVDVVRSNTGGGSLW